MNSIIWKAVITCVLVICIWYEAECDINQSPARQYLESGSDLIYSNFQNYISGDKTMVSDDTDKPHVRYPREAQRIRNRNRRRKSNKRRTRPPQKTTPTVTEEYVELNANTTDLPPCVPCLWRQERKRVRIQMIKEEILRKLKLDEIPRNVSYKDFQNITGNILPNENGTFNDEPVPEPDPVGDVTRIFTPAANPPWPVHDGLGDVIYFNIKEDILNSHLIKAELRIYVKPMDLPGVAYINLYPIIKDHFDNYTYEMQPYKRHKVRLNPENTGKYHNINIGSLVEKWTTRQGKLNYGLRIVARTIDDESFAVISTNINEYRPRFWVEINGESPPRSRRSQKSGIPDICEDISKEERCCRYNLLVEFEDFGSSWDWIIHPRSYHAFYCAGFCGYSDSNTKHGVLVQLSRGVDHLGGPCCTPIKSSPISMIYVDSNGRIIYNTLPDMVADKCGCN